VSQVLVSNKTTSLPNPLRLKKCASFSSKFAGLMMQPEITKESGIIFFENSESKITTSIHMFFMKFDIGVVWLDQKKRVVDTCYAKKWHPYYAPKSPAQYTLEIHPDRLNDFRLEDQIDFNEEN
jgi:uncharacterized membrane protein (UPF0127 family)